MSRFKKFILTRGYYFVYHDNIRSIEAYRLFLVLQMASVILKEKLTSKNLAYACPFFWWLLEALAMDSL